MSKRWRVNYEIYVEPRTDTFLGTTRSDLQNLTTVVEALSGGQARSIVEAQYGGPNRCRALGAVPLD